MNKMAVFTFMSRTLAFCFWSTLLVLFLILPTIMGIFKQERSLTIFTWPLMLDPIYLKKFERESGIKLRITYYDSSFALLNKLNAGNGSGYDLIIADDHTAELIIQKQLAKKFDRTRLPFFDQIDPQLLSHYYDPNNAYTIPHYWGMYGIGYDQDSFIGEPPATWKLLFDKTLMPAKICMTDDAREACMIAAQYLFGSIDALKDPGARKQVKQLLIQQKEQVEVYSISRADNLLQTKSCPLACITSPEVTRLQKEHANIKFLSPVEGTFLIIDAFLVPAATQKDTLVYEFLNFLYTPESINHHTKLFGYCSPLLNVGNNADCPIKMSSALFFRNIIAESVVNNIWIEILAS